MPYAVDASQIAGEKGRDDEENSKRPRLFMDLSEIDGAEAKKDRGRACRRTGSGQGEDDWREGGWREEEMKTARVVPRAVET